jgi:hypothetical protein
MRWSIGTGLPARLNVGQKVRTMPEELEAR